MHKSAIKCNETVGKWCKNKHKTSKIIDTLETYHAEKYGEWLGSMTMPHTKEVWTSKLLGCATRL
jgi:hypothetical protein